MKEKSTRFFALGGIAGPILFALVTVICAELRPDYNHFHDFISELGASESLNNTIMNFAGFVPSGLLIGLFGLSLTANFPKSLISKIGSLLIIVFGLGMMTAGIFSCDPGCPPEGSMESLIHDSVSAIMFVSAILGILLLGFSFRELPELTKFMFYSLVTGVLAAILLVVMISTFESRSFTGLWQRLLLLVIFQWTIVFGLYLFISDKHP